VKYFGDEASLATIETVLKCAGVEFIDENGGGSEVRLRKRQQKKKTQEAARSAAHAQFRKQRFQSD
jgi:hypothetical protein